MKKRWLSILLVCGMLLTTLPSVAFAEGEEPSGCVCTAACTAEVRNTDCPICGAEDAALEDCGQYKGEQENELNNTQEPAEPQKDDQEGDQEAQPEESKPAEPTEPAEEPAVEVEPQVAAQAVANDKAVAVQAEHKHCACGGSINAGGHTSHADVAYQPWDGSSRIDYTNKKAYVYLTGNVTISNDLQINGCTLYLCLNGKTYKSNGTKKIKVSNGGRLVLCDCAGGGSIKGVSSGWGGGCVYLYNSTLDMFGGKLTGAKVKHGGGVALDDENCTLNLYGGSISGNTATVRGGGVYMLNGGTINLYGGSISNNTASGTGMKGLGGGVFLEAGSGSINLHGGSISNNTARGVYGGGVYLNSAGTVTITGGEISGNKLTNTGNGGGICLNKDGAKLVMSGGSVKNNSASVGAGVNFANGGTFTLSGGSITGNTASGDGGGVRLFRNVIFTMTGGEISGNKSNGVNGGTGGGVQMEDNSSTLNISGAPVIKDNTVSGKANNVHLLSGKTLTISGAMSTGASIGVTTEDTNYPVVFSNAYSMDYSDYFFSDAGKAIHYNSDKQLEISKDAAHTHTGGTAYCDKKAVCETCGKEYGAFDPNNHSGTLGEWKSNGAEHWQVYSCCKVEANRAAHSGGTADCQNKAICTTCGNEYGTGDPTNHRGTPGDWKTSNTEHWKEYSCCSARVEKGTHAFTEKVVGKQYLKSSSTCEAPAEYYKSCATCGLSSEGTEGEATFSSGGVLAHDWSEPSYTWTPVADGYMCAAYKKCNNCSYNVSDVASVTYAVTKAPTCLNTGVGTYTATFSDAFGFPAQTKDVAIPATGHDWGTAEYTWTPTETGYTCTAKRVCQTDKTHVETEDVTADYAVLTEPTCLTAGLGRYQASFEANWAEDASKDVPLSALDHDWGAWTSNGNGTHTRVCARNDSHTENGTCSGGTATCTELATCTVCGGTYGELAAHDFTAEVAEEDYLKSEATCTESAVYYKSCTACGLTSEGTEQEDTFQSGDPLGHDYDTKWSQDETHHWHVCKRCQDVADLEEHTASGWITDKAATAKADGEKHKECTVCGYLLETDTIPATGSKNKPGKKDDTKSDTKTRVKTNAPKTGDDSSLLLWTALLGVSGVGVTGVVLYGRKRKDNE